MFFLWICLFCCQIWSAKYWIFKHFEYVFHISSELAAIEILQYIVGARYFRSLLPGYWYVPRRMRARMNIFIMNLRISLKVLVLIFVRQWAFECYWNGVSDWPAGYGVMHSTWLHTTWSSCQMRKTGVLRMRRECRERFPRHTGLATSTCIAK